MDGEDDGVGGCRSPYVFQELLLDQDPEGFVKVWEKECGHESWLSGDWENSALDKG